MFEYAYLIGGLLFGLLWLLIFLFRKDLRKEMLILGLIIAPFGLMEPFFYGEYWAPELLINFHNWGIEGVLLMFFQGGISAVIYDFFTKNSNQKFKSFSEYIQDKRFIFVIFSGGLIGGLFWLFSSLNIIYCGMIGMCVCVFTILIYRPDLWKNSLISGLSFSISTWIILFVWGLIYKGIFESWWNISSLSGFDLGAVPLEEVFWHFFVGAVIGPLYELGCGIKVNCK